MSIRGNVWILEDDKDISDILQIVLAEEGYQVKQFDTIRSLKEEINTHIPDLLLTDVMLPDGNGLDVCKYLKTEEDAHLMPIIVMSASANLKDVKRNYSADDFIAKPFDLYEMIGKVNRLTN